MGELVGPLLGALTGRSPSNVGVVPPENGMTEAVMGFPSVMRGGISETGALPPGIGGGALPGEMGNEAEGVVRGFKPKKISFWGALGDQLLKHWGNKPAFEQRILNKNVQKAMQGFTNEPEEALSRLAQIPGMQEKAWELLDKHRDNTRADQQLDRLTGNDMERTLKNASGLAGIALANPSSRASAIARYNQILRAKGLDQFLLEDDVDDATLAAIAGGAIPPDKREQLELRRIRLEQTGADTESKIEDRTVRQKQGERRLNIQQQNADRPRETGGRGKAQPIVRMTPGGNQFIMHPSGLAGVLMKPDGTQIEMIKFGNGWKIRPPKEPAK